MVIQRRQARHYVLNEVVILRGQSQAEAAFRSWEEEKKQDRYTYWRMLKLARNDFIELTDQASIEYTFDDGAFYYYLQKNYGLKPEIIDGKIGQHYNVVDEKKYMLFILKYSG